MRKRIRYPASRRRVRLFKLVFMHLSIYYGCSFVTMFKNTIRLACKLGTVIRLGAFTMVIQDKPDVSSYLWLPDPNKPNELVRQDKIEQPETIRIMKC